MFDTMTATKIVGALCGSLLIFLLLGWAGSEMFATQEAGHGEGTEAAYVIEVEGGEGHGDTDTTEAAGPSIDELLLSADVGKGEKVFAKCKACHKLDAGANGTGPSLHGIVNNAVGAVSGYNYSSAMAGYGGSWDPARLSQFLTNPKRAVPGTKMGFAGVKKDADRADLIAYLLTIGE